MTDAETETTFRFDHEERVLWACTTDPHAARRWKAAGYSVAVKGTVRGEAHSWEAKIPADHPNWRNEWRQCVVKAIPAWPSCFVSGVQAPSAEGDPPISESGVEPGVE